MNSINYNSLVVKGGELELTDEALAFLAKKLEDYNLYEILSQAMNLMTEKEEVRFQNDALLEIQKQIKELSERNFTTIVQNPSDGSAGNVSATESVTFTKDKEEEKKEKKVTPTKPKIKIDLGNIGGAINKMGKFSGGD